MTVESVWEATGVPVPDAPPLDGDRAVDVAVIGAGYCGLNAALELAERGQRVVVLDALALGKGASGRSGGFVAGRFRMRPPAVRKRHGSEMVCLLERISAASVEQVERNVAQYDIPDAHFARYGSVRCAINKRHLDQLAAGICGGGAPAGEFGNASAIRLLNRDEIAAETGSHRFVGGTLDPNVAGIHPFNYTMGLVRALGARGVPVHSETPVTRLRPDGSGMLLKTARGAVRAKQTVMASDAYSRLTGATRPLAKGVIPFRSAAIATARLPAGLMPPVMPNGRMMVDTKRILRWFRRVDERVVIGGRGAGTPAQDDAAYGAMHRNLLEVFPQLANIPIEFRWSGYVGMTLDQLPHVGRISPGVVIAGGFNGNGVALASLFGRYAARIAVGDPPETGILGAEWFRTLPFPRISGQGVRVAARWFQTLDALGV